MSALIRDDGMSTRVCLAVTALRIRESMSAMGSVIFFSSQLSALGSQRSLPARFRDACDISFERQLAETETAERELPHVGARTAAQAAAVAQPDLVFRRLRFFRDLRGRCHKPSALRRQL